MTLKHSKERGGVDFSITKVIILMVLAVGIYGSFQYIRGYFKAAAIQGHMTSTILSNKTASDEELKSMVQTNLKRAEDVDIDPAQIVILRSEDGSHLTLSFTYEHNVGVPLLDKSLIFGFPVAVDENLKRIGN